MEQPNRSIALRQLADLEASLQNPTENDEVSDAGFALVRNGGDVAAELLIRATLARDAVVRRWAAIALADATSIESGAYLVAAYALLFDIDEGVREVARESFFFHEPHPDLTWRETAPLVRRLI